MRPNIKAFNSKGNHEQQNQMATHRMGKNICKWSDQQGIILPDIQTAFAALSQKANKQSNQKMSRRSK